MPSELRFMPLYTKRIYTTDRRLVLESLLRLLGHHVRGRKTIQEMLHQPEDAEKKDNGPQR
jgi:hypothetical protein